ncbi:hypothetical protein [Streptomyces sp. NPDC058953]|uniref:hypothetical protein n=1 Tax=unclassified Streptomyces TaxID=2593676 RepID=UPI0036ABB080
MDEERARRLVTALRERRVMAHVVDAGVYEFGIRVVLDTGIEALWDVDGAAGLDAEIVGDGVLIGFVPHVPGSEEFTDEQLVTAIATTRYALDGLSPPAAPGGDAVPPGPPGDVVPPTLPTPPAPSATPAEGPSPPGSPPRARYQRRAHWIRRNG